MKRCLSLTFAFVLMLFCTSAHAEIMDFPRFTIDVPDTWSASINNNVVGLISKDGTASVSIVMDEVKKHSLHDLAVHFSTLLQGSTPELNEGGYYSFTFKNEKALKAGPEWVPTRTYLFWSP